MPFVDQRSFAAPTIGDPMGLGRTHIDLAGLTLTFVYHEHVHRDVWVHQERQQVLTLHEHYRIDRRRGVIELLEHPFWKQQGRWAAGDREEPLLYKDQVRHDRGQRIEFMYEYYTPEEVDDPSGVDMNEIDRAASARLGYDVRKYIPSPDPPGEPAPWDWEKEKKGLEVA